MSHPQLPMSALVPVTPTDAPPPPPYTVLIPARMASSRLPDKPLADLCGLPMIVHVARQAQRSAAQRVVVAADDPRILAACAAHGVQAVLTDAHHSSGSDRLAQACSLLALDDASIIVNVQGDEPLIDPALIDATALVLHGSATAHMATAAHPIEDVAQYLDPNVVKVVCNAQGLAQYFSRAPIPWHRDRPGQCWWQPASALTPIPSPLRHIGIYAYRAGFLRQFPSLPVAPTEQTESLEQLRVLWHGYHIAVHITAHAPGPGVDTPHDLERVRSILAAATR